MPHLLRFQTLFTLLFVLTLSNHACAMLLDKVIVNFDPKTPRQDVRITNDKGENLYLKVDVLEVQNPGEPNEKRVLVKDPSKSGILVTPAKMIVAPNAHKLLRIVNLKPNESKERIFRINVTPILPPLSSPSEKNQVRIVVAYQILALIAPKKAIQDIETSREGKAVSITNNGNAYVYFTQGKQCDTPKGDTNCQELPSQRLYAGNTWKLELPYDQPFEFLLQSADGNRKKSFK